MRCLRPTTQTPGCAQGIRRLLKLRAAECVQELMELTQCSQCDGTAAQGTGESPEEDASLKASCREWPGGSAGREHSPELL